MPLQQIREKLSPVRIFKIGNPNLAFKIVGTILTLHDPQTARAYHEAGYWRGDTMYALARGHAAARPGAYALRDGSKRLTWSELVHWTDALGADLDRAGLRCGSRVSVWLPVRA